MIRGQFREVVSRNKLRLVLGIIRLRVGNALVVAGDDESRRLRIAVGPNAKRAADGKCAAVEKHMLDHRAVAGLSVTKVPSVLNSARRFGNLSAELVSMQITVGQ